MFDASFRMPFYTLNCHLHMICYVNAPRNLYKIRSSPVQAIPKSLVLVNKYESGRFPEFKMQFGSNTDSTRGDSANFLFDQVNSVGIIGGISVYSTLNFLRKLVKLSSKDGKNPFPFVLCSDPILNEELLSFGRSSSLSLGSKGKHVQSNFSQIVQNLRNKRVFLENSGARCIVMPCHISHSWHDEVSKGCSVPFLHMGECVARELKEAKLKPLEAGSPLRIGVLATNATLDAGFYQEKLQNEGFEVLLPDRATMEHTMIPAIDALNSKDIEGARNLIRIALQVLLVRAVNSVILASDDMWDLLSQDDPLLKKCIDPMDALARSTIKWLKSAGKGVLEH
ncbi:Aspartate racemase [Quillaja saponaria]|uniref:Aspartate racemase n=1 Tax=Quillaja saponaria TaxID=32244 RepID=A0AAD7LR86_QUISA|nr:Aspartate racemase [Quillaja saponaria]KAJ7962886.1 Aspartate racemase [Quillaja saponaria]